MTEPWDRTGVVDLFSPDPDDIALPNIAAGLAHTCRFGGTAGGSTASPTTPSTSLPSFRVRTRGFARSGYCTTPLRRTSVVSRAR